MSGPRLTCVGPKVGQKNGNSITRQEQKACDQSMEFLDPSDDEEVRMKSEEDQIVLIMVSLPESSGGTGNDQLETKKDSPLKTIEEKTDQKV